MAMIAAFKAADIRALGFKIYVSAKSSYSTVLRESSRRDAQPCWTGRRGRREETPR